MDNGAQNYRRFLDGDENGLVEIIKDYKDGLIIYLFGFVNNLSVAEELTEDVFVKIGIKKPHFLGKASFKTWLYSVGRNTAVDYIRKQSKNREIYADKITEIGENELLEFRFFKTERKRIVITAMGKLKSEYRQALWLYYFEGFSNKETAEIMKKSVHATETLMCRARQSLKNVLEREGYNYENL